MRHQRDGLGIHQHRKVGDGTFDTNAVVLTGSWSELTHFDFGDLNADGKPDLVVGGQSISVVFRQ